MWLKRDNWGCCGVLTVVTKDCGGAALAGATVTVTGPDGFSKSCTTSLSGGVASCQISLGTAGTYTISVSASGLATSTSTLGHICGDHSVTICVGGLFKFCVTIGGCAAGSTIGNGQSVSLTQGSNTYTATADSSGVACFCLSARTSATVTLTSPGGRYQTTSKTFASGLFTTATCSVVSGSMSLDPASGYHCFCGCPDPVSDTLYLTEPYGNTFTLTYDSGSSSWVGSGTIANTASCVSCASVASYSMTYSVPARFVVFPRPDFCILGVEGQIQGPGLNDCPVVVGGRAGEQWGARESTTCSPLLVAFSLSHGTACGGVGYPGYSGCFCAGFTSPTYDPAYGPQFTLSE